MAEFALVEVKKVSALEPAVLSEGEAVRYLCTNRTDFRKLVKAGHISFFHQIGLKGRRYHREVLDAYISEAKKRTMPLRENPEMSLKGVS